MLVADQCRLRESNGAALVTLAKGQRPGVSHLILLRQWGAGYLLNNFKTARLEVVWRKAGLFSFD
jgi:hypothetical protein